MNKNLKTVIFDTERSRFLKGQIEWAQRWLNTPADQLPGVLTHEKCNQVIDDARDELLEHTGLQVVG